ncbi:hypothetical protein RND81_10G222500 [Saponaria officinalis]
MRSQDQRRKIDELEAQLHEAEDIVGNLRAELNMAHMNLDELSNKQTRASSNVTVKIVDENGSSQPVIRETVLVSQAERISGASRSSEERGCSGEPEVPSIIIKRKETELYRNGCTQRIRACDGNLLKGEKPIVADATWVEDINDGADEDTVDLMQYIKILKTRRTRASKYNRNSISDVIKEACLDHEKGARSNSGSTAPSYFSDMGALPENALDNKLTEICAGSLNKDLEVASSSVSTAQLRTFRNGLGTLNSTTKVEVKNSSSFNSDVKLLDSCDGLSGPQKDRILKYTFQRKRKKGPVVDDDSD